MRQVIPVRGGPVSQQRPLIGQALTMKPSDWPLSHATPRWLRIKITTIHWPELVSTPTRDSDTYYDCQSDLDAITISPKWDWLCLYHSILIVSSSWSLPCYDLSRLQSESDSWQLTPSLQWGFSLVKSPDTVLWLAKNISLRFIWHLTQKLVSMKSHSLVMNCHEIFFPVFELY